MVKSKSGWMRGSSGTLEKEHGSHLLVSYFGAQKTCLKVWVYRDRTGSKPITNLIQSNSISVPTSSLIGEGLIYVALHSMSISC